RTRWRSSPITRTISGRSRCTRDGVPFCGNFQFQFVADLCYSSPHFLILTWLRFAGGEPQGLHLEASGPGGTRSQPPARRGGEEAEGRGGGGRRQEEEEEGKPRKACKIAHA